MAPWLRFVEAYAVQLLLRTPAFHRAVEKVARGVHRVRNGVPPEELGGTKIDQPSFMKHFTEEVQTQLGRAEAKTSGEITTGRSAGVQRTQQGAEANAPQQAEEAGADTVWQNAKKTSSEAPKQGFMGEYIGALREQIRGGK